jgi:hypothetical protein
MGIYRHRLLKDWKSRIILTLKSPKCTETRRVGLSGRKKGDTFQAVFNKDSLEILLKKTKSRDTKKGREMKKDKYPVLALEWESEEEFLEDMENFITQHYAEYYANLRKDLGLKENDPLPPLPENPHKQTEEDIENSIKGAPPEIQEYLRMIHSQPKKIDNE